MVLLHKLKAISYVQGELGTEEALCHARQILLRHSDHILKQGEVNRILQLHFRDSDGTPDANDASVVVVFKT